MARFPLILLPPALQSPQVRQPDTLRTILSKTVRPTSTHAQPPRGRSEGQFESYLWRYFPGKIHTGVTLVRDNPGSPYVPDFAYIDSDLGLHIDIEIDEPYTQDTRQPLHYADCPKDQQRNQWFLNWGWIVIRFSEAQVVQHPEACCKTIASVVATLTSDSTLMLPFQPVPALRPQPIWSYTEAQQMAEQDFRSTYLTAQPSQRQKVSLSPAQRKPRNRQPVITANFTFYCPVCGDGPIRWQGHYICCPTCQYDSFAL